MVAEIFSTEVGAEMSFECQRYIPYHDQAVAEGAEGVLIIAILTIVVLCIEHFHSCVHNINLLKRKQKSQNYTPSAILLSKM